MNPNLLREPERWSERDGGTSAEDDIGASFKRIKDATEPSNMASMRWARRAMAPAARGGGRRLWVSAIVATLLVGGGAVAGVAWHAAVTKARVPAADVDTPGPAPARHAAGRRAL